MFINGIVMVQVGSLIVRSSLLVVNRKNDRDNQGKPR